jgi:DNA-binding FadR family transcriptional regulator
MNRAVVANDGVAHVRADIAFHRSLCRVAGNEVLLQLWETLARRLTIIFGLAALEKELDGIYQEHVEFLDLLKHGNLKAIRSAVEDHIIGQGETIDFEGLIAARRQLRQSE